MTQVYLSQALPSYRVVYICRNGDEAPFDKYMFMVFQDKISHAAQSVLELALQSSLRLASIQRSPCPASLV